jgi:hypothetical protein
MHSKLLLSFLLLSLLWSGSLSSSPSRKSNEAALLNKLYKTSDFMTVVTQIENYSNIVRGFFVGIFCEMELAETAGCFNNLGRLWEFLTLIDNVIEETGRPTVGDVLTLIKDSVVMVIMGFEDCQYLGSAFTTLFGAFQNLVLNFQEYWANFVKNLAFSIFDLAGDIGNVTSCWNNGEFLELGETIGEMLYDVFIAKMTSS